MCFVFQQILEDLKATFGSKVQLSPADIAEIIGISEGQQANLRSEGRFPIPYTKDGGRIRISIYALAKYLAECCSVEVKQEMKSVPATLPRSDKKAMKGHLEKGWWLLRKKQITSIIWRSNLESELAIKLTNKTSSIIKT